MNTFEIEALMDEEIETHESEAEVPANSLALVGDSLPAFGIVAAVMGVVHALGFSRSPCRRAGGADRPRDGGDFPRHFAGLRIYLPTGERSASEKRRNHQNDALRQSHAAHLTSNGYAPPIAVEFGRKTLYSSERPSFIELEEHVRAVKNPQQQTTTEDA